MKKIAWITADYFVDVDLPVIPSLSQHFEIEWYILSDSIKLDTDKIRETVKDQNVSLKFIAIKKKWYSPLSFLEFISIFKRIDSGNHDLIYLDLTSLSYTYVAADLVFNKSKVVFATHNVTTPKGARFAILANLNMSYLLSRFRNFHVFSKNQKQVLESNLKNKNILYAPLALKDFGTLPHKKKQDVTNFLTFGHIRNYKRVDLLINAAQIAYENTGIDFKVIIAGNCSNWSRYEQLIKYSFLFDLKIGFIDDNDIPLLIAKSHFMVLPYQDLAQSGVITVAFNYSLPVITSDIPQFKEFVNDGENGYLFKSESAEDLATVLIKCLKMKSIQYESLERNVNTYVSKYLSTKAITTSYIKYFENLISN